MHIRGDGYFRVQQRLFVVHAAILDENNTGTIPVRMLQKLGTKSSDIEKEAVIEDNLNDGSSKVLLVFVFMQFKKDKVLGKMHKQTRAILLIGLRSFIQCSEEVIANRSRH